MSDEIARPASGTLPLEGGEQMPDAALGEAAEAVMFGALPDAQGTVGRRLA